MRRLVLVALGLGLAISWGCERKAPFQAGEPSIAATPRAAVRLTLLVVDDPALAAGAKLHRGEWAERSGGELVVEEMTVDELLDAEQLTADVIVYPSRQVGTLVTRDWLRPVRETLLRDDAFAFDDLLPLVRNQVMRYGGQVYGVSLGEPPLMLAWQAEDSPVPDTWKEFDRATPLQANEGQVAVELIVRAASCVDPRYRAELLFDPQTLAPRLTAPPMVRALKEIVARSGHANDPVTKARITWPTFNDLNNNKPWQFAALPRASSVFDSLRQQWQPQENDEPLAVLGFAGRSASVTTSSRNATSAFKLLAWLASGETATQLGSRSHATVWFRHSQASRADRWLSDRGGEQTAALVTRLLSSDNYFLLPRLPGIDRYLAVLNEAVGQAIRGVLPPEKALESAGDQWNKLTESLGRSQQLLAYRRHLGLVTSQE